MMIVREILPASELNIVPIVGQDKANIDPLPGLELRFGLLCVNER